LPIEIDHQRSLGPSETSNFQITYRFMMELPASKNTDKVFTACHKRLFALKLARQMLRNLFGKAGASARTWSFCSGWSVSSASGETLSFYAQIGFPQRSTDLIPARQEFPIRPAESTRIGIETRYHRVVPISSLSPSRNTAKLRFVGVQNSCVHVCSSRGRYTESSDSDLFQTDMS